MNKLVINGIYKHFKGDYYIVVDTAINSDDGETYVIYRMLYGECKLYIRKLSDFLSPVDHKKYPNVLDEYRFTLQDIKSKRGDFK